MAEIIWSQAALNDIDEIANYIARDSEHYANAVVEKIVALSRRLADHPRAGRVVPELNDEATRERFVYNYRMIYHVEENRILILAVIHGKRLIESIQDRF